MVKLPVPEHDFRTPYRASPVKREGRQGRGPGSPRFLRARARSPSEQAGAEGQREVCAVVAAPLDGDQASRGRHGAPGRQSETSDCGRGPSGLSVKLAVRPRPGPLLSGSSPRQSRRLLSRGDPTAATRAPRSAPTRTPAARRPPSALLGSSAPSLPAAPARFKRKRRFKIWR